ncbi:MlaD family protein [Sphaerospermopsis kisseleviana CS-549]|uniref:MlaD family protein n=1 Tax=Sphaerospermopsis kisseleviana CS-549 TaxID=3021783 RepID=A0ABT4ZWD5_9CYAN|nr:MlaD family protein [Sphaerospermopsis kisseleviana]MDB9443731.1 MlaD family protein [Sphaerospermopsis kisseleviana CS-549]BAZ80102.1 mammalian cell entry related domain-containing protein [Sphaerospermopsis kisseleviana NIES-73]
MRGLISGFTSTRTFREGSVGLLILLGLGAFGVIWLWLNRITPGSSSYKAVVEFANAGGMQKGSPVRYRGVKVGSISSIKTGANAVNVEIEINDPQLKIPADSKIEANQSGLINESIIDISPPPNAQVPQDIAGPLEKDCNPGLIICNESAKLKGEIGISVDELIRQSSDFAAQYNNKEFYDNVNRLLVTSANAADSIAKLSREMQSVSRSFQGQLGTFSNTAVTIQRATNELTTTTTKTANQLGTTASEFSTTAKQASKLLNNLDELLTTNRSALVGTLNNITQTSNQLRQTVSSLSPAVNRLTEGELLKNLEILSANAAEASANLKNASKNLNDPQNIVLLQQTLDAARVTFENTQKITSDLDELTGDPKFRQNLLQLVNGLSKLVSSTENMQQQTKVAFTLDALKTSMNPAENITPQPTFKAASQTPKSLENIPKNITAKPEIKAVEKINKVVIFTPLPTTEIIQFNTQPELLPPVIISEPSSPEKAVTPTVPAAVESAENIPQNTITPTPDSSQQQLLQKLRERTGDR